MRHKKKHEKYVEVCKKHRLGNMKCLNVNLLEIPSSYLSQVCVRNIKELGGLFHQ